MSGKTRLSAGLLGVVALTAIGAPVAHAGGTASCHSQSAFVPAASPYCASVPVTCIKARCTATMTIEATTLLGMSNGRVTTFTRRNPLPRGMNSMTCRNLFRCFQSRTFQVTKNSYRAYCDWHRMDWAITAAVACTLRIREN
jgi:hypothetical protein